MLEGPVSMSRSIEAMPILIRLLVVAPLLLSIGTSVRAQALGFFGGEGPFLGWAELIQADQAARRLLRPRPAALGMSEIWAEPTLGDNGTLTLERAYQSHGRDCRAVR